MAKIKIVDVIDHQAKAIKSKNYPIAKIKFTKDFSTRVQEDLPFRVKFSTIGIGAQYGPNNPAPIGIAIIGFNNYIL
jgi:hypothetical protein